MKLECLKPNIPFNKPFFVGKELYNITQAVMADGHISGDGRFTRLCHTWLEEKLGCPGALLTMSGTAALEMAAILCDLQPGDEVIMPSFTFVSTANAFVLRGAVPVFIDIRPDSLNLDESLIEPAITERTKAIVPVHYAGFACAMDEILQISAQYGLLVVEDAAHAMLSTYRGRYLGTLGHLGCLSFHETKNIISGEGGLSSSTILSSWTERKSFGTRAPTDAASSGGRWTNTAGWISAHPFSPAI